jgi:hypothetical protein
LLFRRKRRLMEILDQHCAEENAKLAQRRSRRVLRSEYDFLYLPVDFRYVLLPFCAATRSCCGYYFSPCSMAFVSLIRADLSS